MAKKKFYLKERHNPQFDKPYYVALGQMTKKDAMKHENTLYGTNVVTGYDEQEYNRRIHDLVANGYSVTLR